MADSKKGGPLDSVAEMREGGPLDLVADSKEGAMGVSSQLKGGGRLMMIKKISKK